MRRNSSQMIIVAVFVIVIAIIVIFMNAPAEEQDEPPLIMEQLAQYPPETDEIDETGENGETTQIAEIAGISTENGENAQNNEEMRAILHVTQRSEDWHTIDIRRGDLAVGDEIVVVGRTGGNIASTETAYMLIGGGGSPWNWITSTEITQANQPFTLHVQLTENHITESQFENIRIQTNAAAADMPFFVDDIAIMRGNETLYSLADDIYIQGNIGTIATLMGHPFLAVSGNPTIFVVPHNTAFGGLLREDGTIMATGDLQNILLLDFEQAELPSSVTVGGQMQGELTAFDGNATLRLENTTGNFTSGDGNFITVTLPTPLPVGSTIEVSWDVFVPSAENPDVTALIGPGININGQFGSDPHQPTNTNPAPGDLTRRIPMDEWVNTTVEFTNGIAVGDVHFFIFRFRVNDNQQQPTVLYIDNISIATRGAVEVYVPTFDLSLPSLAVLFEEHFLVGNTWSNPIQMGVGNTEDGFIHHFNAVTAENHHKPSFIAGAGPDPATWNFTIQDEIVNFAETNGMAMIGHTLVWHAQSPMWLTTQADSTEPLTRAQAMANMELYISTVAGRYAGRIHSWDVLNEAIASSVGNFSGDWRNHIRRDVNVEGGEQQWYAAFANGADTAAGEGGEDFIFYAFYFARQADPNAILFYNDYNEEQPGKRDAIAQMVEQINERWAAHASYDGRLLIEGIGLQSHYHLDQWATNFNNIRPAIERFIETGVILAITELDITIGTQANPSIPLSAAQELRQAEYFRRVFSYYLEFAEHIERVTIWGKADNQSWRAWGSPLLFNNYLSAKEAFHAVVELVE
ncbi:MAG: endo-1,4-beta-xylanase [Defluviitaleaceae bacterium]|nr:endo-1,4-beta-xylanase [Defluviitaleaceae bacterium]